MVEAKQGVIENMAPVLAAVFTPLFTLLLVVFLAVLLATGNAADADRWVLILVDLVLVVIVGLHLYWVSARTPTPTRLGPTACSSRWSSSALLVDAVVLAAMAGRIGEYGASPNKLAALGENLVLLGNLAGRGVAGRSGCQPAGVRSSTLEPLAVPLPAGHRACGPRSWWFVLPVVFKFR